MQMFNMGYICCLAVRNVLNIPKFLLLFNSLSTDGFVLHNTSPLFECKYLCDYLPRIVLTFLNLFQVRIKLTIGPEMEMPCTFVKFEDTDSQMTPEIRLLTSILTRLLQRRHVRRGRSYVRRKVWLVYIFV
jgi:hypothetical protein